MVGTAFSSARLDGVLSLRVRRDGANATDRLADCLRHSKYGAQLRAVLLQGIAFAGFNVVDLARLHQLTGLTVVAVARRRPGLEVIRRALLQRVPGGGRKWRLIEKTGPMEAVAEVYIQRCGLSRAEAENLVCGLQINGLLPEPLRLAHLVAGGLALDESGHRA